MKKSEIDSVKRGFSMLTKKMHEQMFIFTPEDSVTSILQTMECTMSTVINALEEEVDDENMKVSVDWESECRNLEMRLTAAHAEEVNALKDEIHRLESEAAIMRGKIEMVETIFKK